MKTINEITLSDMMGEDLEVWIRASEENGFDLEIEGENGETLVNEKGVHPCAMQSYADMCRRFLHFYDAAVAKREAA